jgi:DNA-binding transcriptional ArsR family regulator
MRRASSAWDERDTLSPSGERSCVIRFEVGPADIAATRFAVSPSFELALLVRELFRAGGTTPIARRFADGFAAVRADPVVRTLAYLHGPVLGASFSVPPPAGMAQTIEDDLAVLRAVPDAVVREEVAEIRAVRRPSAEVEAVLEDPRFTDRLAGGMARAWAALLAPSWPRVRAVLERDVRFRAERLSEVGWSGALGGMHRQIAWTGDAIAIDRPTEATQALGGRGLLLVPSVFLGQGLAVVGEAPWQPTIVYPCRGAGLVFEEVDAPPDPLAPLLGRTRAGLLLALATPSSTTQLAALTGASIGATGDHLKVLLDAGLVTRARVARSVVYRRTSLGDALAAA